ncbi:MAG TPA: hypothetical protein VN709_08350, partial [Terriglobales bacterium]|nr:hypothetical protein [Terriglobales bacterium]
WRWSEAAATAEEELRALAQEAERPTDEKPTEVEDRGLYSPLDYDQRTGVLHLRDDGFRAAQQALEGHAPQLANRDHGVLNPAQLAVVARRFLPVRAVAEEHPLGLAYIKHGNNEHGQVIVERRQAALAEERRVGGDGAAKPPRPLFSLGAEAGSAEPNEIERRPELGRAALWHQPEASAAGVLYLRSAGAIDEIMRQAVGERYQVNGMFLPSASAERLGAALGRVAAFEGPVAETKRELARALEASPQGLVTVVHQGAAAEATAWTRLEEFAHLWQALADAGDPGAAISANDARKMMEEAQIRGAELLRIYRPVLDARVEQAAPIAAAEIGARLLLGEMSRLGVAGAAGDMAARDYLGAVARRWGNAAIARASRGVPSALSGQLRSRVAGLAGKAGEDLELPGGETGGGWNYSSAVGSIGGRGGLREPERGPIAAVFRAWDRATEPLARAGAKVEGALSRYHGTSDRARAALRSYAGRREFAALQTMRAATDLYRTVKDELVWPKSVAEAAPALLRIQHAIEGTVSAPLRPEEQRVAAALIAVRDAITVREVARGWLTPDALRGARGASFASLESLPETERAHLGVALEQWSIAAAKAQAQPREAHGPLHPDDADAAHQCEDDGAVHPSPGQDARSGGCYTGGAG